MSTIIVLKDANDEAVVVDQGESHNIVGTLSFGDTQFSKSQLVTLLMTLYNLETAAIINSRDEVDILDAANCTVATDGTVTIRLQPADNTIVDTDNVEEGSIETHVVRLEWTWNDGVTDRTGRQEMSFDVRRLFAVA